jgi:hypothetical protein
MTRPCKHCDKPDSDHIAIGGILLCATQFEERDPECYWCKVNALIVPRNMRRTHYGPTVSCEIDPRSLHDIGE